MSEQEDKAPVMAGVEMLFPRTGDLSMLLDRRRRVPLLDEPFSEKRLGDLAALSRAIVENPATRRDSGCVALAHWLRAASMKAIADAHPIAPHGGAYVRTCAGLVFHIAPSNVDTMFAYSWALAHLCGNVSIVRLPSARGGVLEALLDVFAGLDAERPGMAAASAFVGYGHDDAITARIGAACDQRIVWGGDETVRRIRAVPLNPHAGERVFPSKFSYTLVNAGLFLCADAKARSAFVSAIAADIFPFDQKACSSPHTVFWAGSAEEYSAAASLLDEALAAHAAASGVADSPSRCALRLDAAFEAASRGGVRARVGVPALTSLRCNPDAIPERLDCGAGFITHARLESPEGLAQFAGAGDQTIGHWGFEAEEIIRLARVLGRCGIDRVVPVGRALAFSHIWDGVDLADELTRKVALR
jgi:hypothetical protein